MGQRINKVADMLSTFEKRLTTFRDTTGIQDSAGTHCEIEAAEEQRKQELILHGPQDTEQAVSQDDIDALFD